LLLSVAVPIPSLDLLTYSVPDGVAAPPVGARVIVPLGARKVTGLVVAQNAGADGHAIKPVVSVLDADAFVPPDLIALAQWTAEYYACGVGDAIPSLLPPMARGARVDAHKTIRMASITAAGQEALNADVLGKRREALELLAAAPLGIATPELVRRGISSDVISRLASRGYVSLRHDRVDRDPFSTGLTRVRDVSDWSDTPQTSLTRVRGVSDQSETPQTSLTRVRPLTSEQDAALARLLKLARAGDFRVALVHGVTGSGKTELYLRLAAAVLDAGRRVLMLVPEIGLTPAVAAQFRDAFGGRVAIQHSGLSDGERHDQWQRIRRGEVDVVVGTRSAVFAPLDDVGLIVVDEEHDSSYKQEESPRYHGRDVAIVRGQRSRALVVLGSATPSMESYYNATTAKYERVVLEKRVLDRPLAAVTIVDMREEMASEGPDVVLSRALVAALGQRLDRQEQSLVLLNRRGFATAVLCRQCAGTLDCPNCSVSLVVHGDGQSRRARCHYCNYTARVPKACPLCAGPYLEQTGFGTERIEREVAHACPGARVARLDRDAIRRKGALANLLSRFRDGEIDVLVGTQMIAKGHDFPRVTLVGVVSADVGLGMADFRASERTFQLLTQVAGRAGRGEQAGEAIVQTLYPGHYSVRLACRQDYPAFYEKEIDFRRKMRYPPHVALINVVVRAGTFAGAMDDASDVAQKLRATDFHVLGPAPAALGRLRGEYRAQMIIKGGKRKAMREALLAALATRPDLKKRVVVDVDPLSVL